MGRIKIFFFSLILGILFPLSLFGQDSTSLDSAAHQETWMDGLFDFADNVVDKISGKSWSFIPALTYSPETSLGIGARAIKLFRADREASTFLRPSTLPITVLYTLKKQVIFTSELELWKNENRDYFQARVELTDYPFKFYGIGNELPAQQEEFYASRYAYVHVLYERQILPGLYLGPRYEFRMDDIYEKTPEGLLASGQIAGSDNPRLSGLGLSLNYDTRKNIFQPRQGSYHQFSWMSFQPFLGSNHTFNQYQLDLRKYLPLFSGHVLAVQSWMSFTTGNPPFQHLSLIGGSDVMRGYFEGRYRDRQAMVYQAEYRWPIYRNLGIVLFGSAGQVADKMSSYSFGRMKYGGGLGFRYKLNDEGLNIRLDIAIGDQRAFYFGLNEVI